MGPDQQAALDHLLRRPHGGAGGNRLGLLDLARRWSPVATLVETAGDLRVERDRGLPDLSNSGECAAGALLWKVAVHRCPRTRGEPAERVLAVRCRGTSCCLLGGLGH